MILTDAECNQCRIELDKLKALPGGLRDMSEAQARMGRLESALERECSDSSSSADAGAAVVLGLGLTALFTWLLARR